MAISAGCSLLARVSATRSNSARRPASSRPAARPAAARASVATRAEASVIERTIAANRWCTSSSTRRAAEASVGPNHHSSSPAPTAPASAVSSTPPASSRRQRTTRSRVSMRGTRQAEYRKGKLDLRPSMSELPGLKATLKRGALVAAANWPLVAVQFVAESTLKLLLAVPVVGGIFLVVLLLGANADELLAGDVREIVAAGLRRDAPERRGAGRVLRRLRGRAARRIGADLRHQRRDRLAAGGRRGEGRADRTSAAQRAGGAARQRRRASSRFSTAASGCGGATSGSAPACSAPTRRPRWSISGSSSAASGWSGTPACCSGGPWRPHSPRASLIVWITLVNFFYLLTQMVMAVEDIGVRSGVRRALDFVRSSFREIAGIFGVVLLLATIATVASIVATAGFGLITLIPHPRPGRAAAADRRVAGARLRVPVPRARQRSAPI